MKTDLEMIKLVKKIEDQEKEIKMLKGIVNRFNILLNALDKKTKRNSDLIKNQSSDIISLKSKFSK
jgi:hypothetical protein